MDDIVETETTYILATKLGLFPNFQRFYTKSLKFQIKWTDCDLNQDLIFPPQWKKWY